jgi:transposase
MEKKYSIEDLERAVSTVKDGGISIREAERVYSVLFDTIRRRVNGYVDMVCQRPGSKPSLGVELEKELFEAVIELQKIGHGISRK